MKEVNQIMSVELKVLTKLKEREEKEQIKAGEIGLEYNCKGDFSYIRSRILKWFIALFNSNEFKVTEGVAMIRLCWRNG